MIEIVSFPGPDRSVTGDILKELHLTEGRNPVASWGMVRLHSSFFRAENAQIIILFEIPGKGVAGRKGGQKE